jgi:RNA polymerase sigma-70 factor, ECF subfamily
VNSNDLIADLYQQYHFQLYNFALKLVHSPEDAEEVVQDAFIKVIKHPPNYIDHISQWLYRVTRCVAYDLLRSKRCRITALSLDLEEHDVCKENSDPQESYPDHDEMMHPWQALKPLQQYAVYLAACGYTYKEVGTRIDKGEEATRAIISRGRSLLRAAM